METPVLTVLPFNVPNPMCEIGCETTGVFEHMTERVWATPEAGLAA